MEANYERDAVAWANEQAALLRAGNFSEVDIEHLAEEIESVGRSEGPIREFVGEAYHEV